MVDTVVARETERSFHGNVSKSCEKSNNTLHSTTNARKVFQLIRKCKEKTSDQGPYDSNHTARNKIYMDNYGSDSFHSPLNAEPSELDTIKARLESSSGLPIRLRLKKHAARLLKLTQSNSYNEQFDFKESSVTANVAVSFPKKRDSVYAEDSTPRLPKTQIFSQDRKRVEVTEEDFFPVDKRRKIYKQGRSSQDLIHLARGHAEAKQNIYGLSLDRRTCTRTNFDKDPEGEISHFRPKQVPEKDYERNVGLVKSSSIPGGVANALLDLASAAVEAVTSVPEKSRGRGRPGKRWLREGEAVGVVSAPGSDPQPKKKRGRPRKHAIPTTANCASTGAGGAYTEGLPVKVPKAEHWKTKAKRLEEESRDVDLKWNRGPGGSRDGPLVHYHQHQQHHHQHHHHHHHQHREQRAQGPAFEDQPHPINSPSGYRDSPRGDRGSFSAPSSSLDKQQPSFEKKPPRPEPQASSTPGSQGAKLVSGTPPSSSASGIVPGRELQWERKGWEERRESSTASPKMTMEDRLAVSNANIIAAMEDERRMAERMARERRMVGEKMPPEERSEKPRQEKVGGVGDDVLSSFRGPSTPHSEQPATSTDQHQHQHQHQHQPASPHFGESRKHIPRPIGPDRNSPVGAPSLASKDTGGDVKEGSHREAKRSSGAPSHSEERPRGVTTMMPGAEERKVAMEVVAEVLAVKSGERRLSTTEQWSDQEAGEEQGGGGGGGGGGGEPVEHESLEVEMSEHSGTSSAGKTASPWRSTPGSPGGSLSPHNNSEEGEGADEALARRLHREMNCTPARTTRTERKKGRQHNKPGPGYDQVFGNDPGLLPSC